VVNRLEIPQGLSTLLLHWWSEVPSRGEVYEKLPVLQRCHLSVFFECWFLVLFAGPSFMKALLLSGFVLLALYRLCSSESVFL